MPLPVTETPVADTRYVVGDYDTAVKPTVFATKEAADAFLAEIKVNQPWLTLSAVPFAKFDAAPAETKEGK